MNIKTLFFAAVLALQTLWVLATVVVQERSLAEGKVVLLETAPVDPRDLLRGDYAILNYKISSLPLSLFSPAVTNSAPLGAPVFVTLEPQGDLYYAVAASTNRPQATPDQVILKGRIENTWWLSSSNDYTVRIIYGLERFYVHEGTGNPKGKLTAQVAVARSAQGILKDVLIDGRPYAEVMREEGVREKKGGALR
jgi:uncharacterized membrane-anchored protein